MSRYILIEQEFGDSLSYEIDSDDGHQAAREAIEAAGLREATIWVGDPDDPSSYATDAKLRAYP